MAAHGMLKYLATVIEANCLNNDTNVVGRRTYLYYAVCTV